MDSSVSHRGSGHGTKTCALDYVVFKSQKLFSSRGGFLTSQRNHLIKLTQNN